nr:2 oxoglutarate and iron dependent oxygenase [Hymenolepis microstoma]
MVGSFSVNPKYLSDDFQKLFHNIFRSPDGQTLDKDGVEIFHAPFTCAVLPDFLDTQNLDNLEAEALRFTLNRQLNDLFSLNQSNDLISCKDARLANEFPLLAQIREFFATDMLKWMRNVTGTDLDEGIVNSTISRYDKSDYLLCHDDELERRRIAFIIYLVPKDWDIEKDGGSLDLYESGPTPDCNVVPPGSGDYHPWKIVKSLQPSRNCLAFFEVCSKSFHRVAEVIGDRSRLSLHGWFMSDPLPRIPRSSDPVQIPRLPACFVEEKLVFDWINPMYIDSAQQEAIQVRFVETSEIQLPQFFRKANYELLCQSIQGIKDDVWLFEGPMDLRNVSVLPYANEKELSPKLPEPCREVRRLLHSEAMLVILSQLTGVSLHPLIASVEEKEEEPSGSEAKRPRKEDEVNQSIETEITSPRFHRWRSGMYTLLADADSGVISTSSTSKNAVENGNTSLWRLDTYYHIGGYGHKSSGKKDGNVGSISKSAKEGSICGRGDQCWQDDWNGEIVYVSRSDNEELLRVRPEDNALTLVYCEAKDTAKFVRYLNAKASPLPLPIKGEVGSSTPYAYDVSLSYFHHSEASGVEDDGDEIILDEDEEEEFSDVEENFDDDDSSGGGEEEEEEKEVELRVTASASMWLFSSPTYQVKRISNVSSFLTSVLDSHAPKAVLRYDEANLLVD